MALIVVFLGVSVMKFDLAGVAKKKGDFRFWIESDAWRVSFCFSFANIKHSLSLLR